MTPPSERERVEAFLLADGVHWLDRIDVLEAMVRAALEYDSDPYLVELIARCLPPEAKP